MNRRKIAFEAGRCDARKMPHPGDDSTNLRETIDDASHVRLRHARNSHGVREFKKCPDLKGFCDVASSGLLHAPAPPRLPGVLRSPRAAIVPRARHAVVTHASGTFRYRCLRAGQKSAWRRRSPLLVTAHSVSLRLITVPQAAEQAGETSRRSSRQVSVGLA